VGSGSSPSLVEFSSLCHSHKVSRSWLLGACPRSCPVWPGPACLFKILWRIPLPLFGAQGAPPSLPRVFIVLIAYYSVSLFSLGGGQSVQGPMLIWPRVVCGSTVCHLLSLSASTQAIWARVTGGPGALLVSPFNVKWRCSAQAGGVEGSEFCLFSVALPARCVSSVSPRFHFRRLAFCFLPLAAILESPSVVIVDNTFLF
jgi:hypothetical protein